MRRPQTNERRKLGGSTLLPPGPALASAPPAEDILTIGGDNLQNSGIDLKNA